MPMTNYDVWITLPRGGFIVIPAAAADEEAACNTAAWAIPAPVIVIDRVVERKEGAR